MAPQPSYAAFTWLALTLLPLILGAYYLEPALLQIDQKMGLLDGVSVVLSKPESLYAGLMNLAVGLASALHIQDRRRNLGMTFALGSAAALSIFMLTSVCDKAILSSTYRYSLTGSEAQLGPIPILGGINGISQPHGIILFWAFSFYLLVSYACTPMRRSQSSEFHRVKACKVLLAIAMGFSALCLCVAAVAAVGLAVELMVAVGVIAAAFFIFWFTLYSFMLISNRVDPRARTGASAVALIYIPILICLSDDTQWWIAFWMLIMILTGRDSTSKRVERKA